MARREAATGGSPGRDSVNHVIDRLASGQHGVVARAHLLEAGVGPDVVDRRRRAACLRSTHRGVRTLQSDEVTTVEGIPLTTVARTLYDMAPSLGPRELERALAEAVARRLTGRTQIQVVLSRHAGRPGSRNLHAVLEGEDPAFTRSVDRPAPRGGDRWLRLPLLARSLRTGSAAGRGADGRGAARRAGDLAAARGRAGSGAGAPGEGAHHPVRSRSGTCVRVRCGQRPRRPAGRRTGQPAVKASWTFEEESSGGPSLRRLPLREKVSAETAPPVPTEALG